jgi:hypothetical protein
MAAAARGRGQRHQSAHAGVMPVLGASSIRPRSRCWQPMFIRWGAAKTSWRLPTNLGCEWYWKCSTLNQYSRPSTGGAVREAQGRLSQSGSTAVPPLQVAGDDRHAGGLLHHAVDPLGSRPLCAEPGGAGRSGPPPVLHVRHRDLAARILFRGGPADHGGHRPVPDHQRGRAAPGAAMPARRRSGPTCSSTSTAWSMATAMPSCA